MGILESRVIDFDEVFILSANESELPPDSSQNSLFLDVKLKFGIRTHLDMDAIYANHFFNLIKDLKSYIIYNQDFSISSSGEKRNINQLL